MIAKKKKVNTFGELPVMKMWLEKDNLFLLVTRVSGLYTLDFPDGYRADFLADLDKTPKEQMDFTIYKYMGMKRVK